MCTPSIMTQYHTRQWNTTNATSQLNVPSSSSSSSSISQNNEHGGAFETKTILKLKQNPNNIKLQFGPLNIQPYLYPPQPSSVNSSMGSASLSPCHSISSNSNLNSSPVSGLATPEASNGQTSNSTSINYANCNGNNSFVMQQHAMEIASRRPPPVHYPYHQYASNYYGNMGMTPWFSQDPSNTMYQSWHLEDFTNYHHSGHLCK